MSFAQAFYVLVAVGLALGGLDLIFNNRFGLGQRFKDGLFCIAPMTFNMAGILIAAPTISALLGKVAVPLCQKVGIDSAILGSLFAMDMGGATLAIDLAIDPQIGLFSGLIVAPMLGGVITYTLPIGYSLIAEEDTEFFFKGIMLGMITIPAGSFLGGIIMGIDVAHLLINLIPILAITVLLILGLIFCPHGLIRVFKGLNRGLGILTIVGLVHGAISFLTGFNLLPFSMPILEAFVIPGRIAITLMGCLPLVMIISRLFSRLFERIARVVEVNSKTLEALILTMATAIPVYSMLRDMPNKGKTAAMAWLVPAMGLLTAHLTYAIGIDPAMGTPQLAAKTLSGILALFCALVIPAKSAFYSGNSSTATQKV